MKYVLDTHTHTISSGHAYNSLNEMMAAAADRGLSLLAITDHAPNIPGAACECYFDNAQIIDREYYYEKYGKKTRLLFGVELNILKGGKLDLEDHTIKSLDIAIASMHPVCIEPGTLEENTHDYIEVLKNPYVHIIGHPDDGNYPIDRKKFVLAAKEYGKILELNNNSLSPNGPRRNALENDIEMLKLCKEYNQPIVVGSDAHVESRVGNHEEAYKLLQSLDFPEELVINTSVDKLMAYLKK